MNEWEVKINGKWVNARSVRIRRTGSDDTVGKSLALTLWTLASVGRSLGHVTRLLAKTGLGE